MKFVQVAVVIGPNPVVRNENQRVADRIRLDDCVGNADFLVLPHVRFPDLPRRDPHPAGDHFLKLADKYGLSDGIFGAEYELLSFGARVRAGIVQKPAIFLGIEIAIGLKDFLVPHPFNGLIPVYKVDLRIGDRNIVFFNLLFVQDLGDHLVPDLADELALLRFGIVPGFGLA